MRHSIAFDHNQDMTKQSFKDECDINLIMKKFQRTGIITHYAKHGPQYGDIPAIEYQEALNTIIAAENAFAELPAAIRKKFNNNPEEFLEFIQDDSNLDEARKLGLASASPVQTTDQQVTQSEHAAASKGRKKPTEAEAGNTSDSE